MNFDEWLLSEIGNIDTYNSPQEAMRMAWDAAIKQSQMTEANPMPKNTVYVVYDDGEDNANGGKREGAE